MSKDYIFFRGHLDRGQVDEEVPCLLAATEVVQAVCDAGFQKYGFYMRSFSSSPHCFYKYAKTPKNGMYMLRAVKKTDMTTLDILIDTRIYPCFIMIEKHSEWQEETKEVVNTLEKVISDDADQYNWHISLREYLAKTTQHLDKFFSAVKYMVTSEKESVEPKPNVQIGQLILEVKGNNYYNDELIKDESSELAPEGKPDNVDIVEKLKPLFYNNEEDVKRFLKEIENMPPNNITDLVNQWVSDNRISDYGNSRKGDLWKILHGAKLYPRTIQNWNRRVH